MSKRTLNEIMKVPRAMKTPDQVMAALKVTIRKDLMKWKKGEESTYELQRELKGTAKCWQRMQYVHSKDSGERFEAFGTHFVACVACFTVYQFKSANGTSTINNHKCTGVFRDDINTDFELANGTNTMSDHKCFSLVEVDVGVVDDDANTGALLLPYYSEGSVKQSDKQLVAKQFALMCSEDLQPFKIAEGSGFISFLQTVFDLGAASKHSVDVRDLLPTAKTAAKLVTSLSDVVRASVQPLLKKNLADKVKTGFTTDLWTDPIRKVSHLSVTSHLIDANFKVHARTLRVNTFPQENPTAEELRESFRKSLEELGFAEHSSFVVVTDSGSIMGSKDGIQKEFAWIPSAGHKIATQLSTVFNKTTTIVDGQESLPCYRYASNAPKLFDLIDGCKALVAYFKNSTIRLDKALKQESKSRWNSLLRMLESVLESYDEIKTILENVEGGPDLLLPVNKPLLTELVLFLREFEYATKKLEEPQQPTLHLVAYLKFFLAHHCQIRENPATDGNEAPADSEDMKSIKKIVLEVGASQWEIHPFHIVAALLDPRQKDRLTKFGLSTTDIDKAKDMFFELIAEVGLGECESTVEEHPQKKLKSAEASSIVALYPSGDSSDDDAEGESDNTVISEELERYWELKVPSAEKKDYNILTWWKRKGMLRAHEGGFPILARVARSILAIPASSSMSECSVSDAGNKIRKRVSGLKLKNVESMLIVRSNIDLARGANLIETQWNRDLAGSAKLIEM